MPLSELVTVEEGTTLNTLARSAGEYYATVSGTILDQDISKATSEIDEAIEDLDLPKGVTVGVAGVAADMDRNIYTTWYCHDCSSCDRILHPSCNIW